jgi:hypothetical protein
MLIKELVNMAKRDSPDVDELKKVMMAAAAMLSQDRPDVKFERNLRALKECKFLPVKELNNKKRLEDTAGDFFIIDHERFGSAFQNKVALLDFSHEELTTLHPFFRILDLEHRYLSRNVEPQTTARTSIENQKLTLDFRQRAYALSW